MTIVARARGPAAGMSQPDTPVAPAPRPTTAPAGHFTGAPHVLRVSDSASSSGPVCPKPTGRQLSFRNPNAFFDTCPRIADFEDGGYRIELFFSDWSDVSEEFLSALEASTPPSFPSSHRIRVNPDPGEESFSVDVAYLQVDDQPFRVIRTPSSLTVESRSSTDSSWQAASVDAVDTRALASSLSALGTGEFLIGEDVGMRGGLYFPLGATPVATQLGGWPGRSGWIRSGTRELEDLLRGGGEAALAGVSGGRELIERHRLYGELLQPETELGRVFELNDGGALMSLAGVNADGELSGGRLILETDPSQPRPFYQVSFLRLVSTDSSYPTDAGRIPTGTYEMLPEERVIADALLSAHWDALPAQSRDAIVDWARGEHSHLIRENAALQRFTSEGRSYLGFAIEGQRFITPLGGRIEADPSL